MSSVAKLPHTLSAQLRVASGRALNGFKAKLDDLSLSGEAIPLGSCDAKC